MRQDDKQRNKDDDPDDNDGEDDDLSNNWANTKTKMKATQKTEWG